MKTIDIEIEGLKSWEKLKSGDWSERPGQDKWVYGGDVLDFGRCMYTQGLIDAGAKFYRPTECEEGYRWLTDEEYNSDSRIADEYAADGKNWQREPHPDHEKWACGPSYCAHGPKHRHHYRIKLEAPKPETFEHKGQMYEVVTDPEYVSVANQDIYSSGKKWWPVGSVERPLEWFSESDWALARPIPFEVEGVMVAGPCLRDGRMEVVIALPHGSMLPTSGDRVRVSKVKG